MSTRTILTRSWALDSFERSVKSFAQGCLTALGQDVIGVDLFGADVANIALTGASMAVFSLLTSVVSAPARGISPASLMPPGV